MAHIAGLVASGVYPSPVPHCDVDHHHPKPCAVPRWTPPLPRCRLREAVDKAVFPGTPGGPLEHVIAELWPWVTLQPSFKAYSQQVVANAQPWLNG